jgi:single-strand DNA-binding protein
MSVNKVILVGNLGRDPEQPRVLGQNNTRRVVTISLATSESYTDSKTGERKTDTEWHRVELWDNLADVAYKYLKKGATVYVEGKIRTERWTDQAGVERTGIKIRANNLTLLGSRNMGSTNDANQGIMQQTESQSSQTDLAKDVSEQNNNSQDDLPF